MKNLGFSKLCGLVDNYRRNLRTFEAEIVPAQKFYVFIKRSKFNTI